MEKILPSLLVNITALRLICVVLSFLFIPAFQYGVVSIWVSIFSILTALLFGSHLQRIIDVCGSIEGKLKHCKSVLMLIAKITIIDSLGALDLLEGSPPRYFKQRS